MKKFIKQNIKQCLKFLGINRFRGKNNKILYNVNNTSHNKNCLMLYITAPFERGISDAHQNNWQIVEIAKLIGKLGYDVDVVDYWSEAVLNNKYDLIFDIAPRDINCYDNFMKAGAKYIIYGTGSEVRYAYKKERLRCDEANRRHVTSKLTPKRTNGDVFFTPERLYKRADAFFFIGNKYNFKSYTDFCEMPPVYYIMNNGYPFDFRVPINNNTKKNFMFFASSGQVHKGLDLLLDIFSEEGFPCDLYICSAFQNEDDFCEVFEKELYHTSNIHAIGFLDITSDKFREVMCKCAFNIIPSCSEARCGAVLTSLSTGMINITSKDCGHDDEYVINLPNCDLKTIREYILRYSSMDSSELQVISDKSIETIKKEFSKDKFTNSFRDALNKVIIGE